MFSSLYDAFYDFFQLFVAAFLLYAAVKGKGNLFPTEGIVEEYIPKIHRVLRRVYVVGGIAALFAFGLCMLRRAMFTPLYNTDGTVAGVAQNFQLDFAPFVTYQFLTIANVVMAVILVAGLMVPFIWLKKYKYQ